MYFFGTFLPLKNALKLMQIGLYSIAMIWYTCSDRFSTYFPVNSEPSKGVGDISLSHGDESDVKLTASVCTSRINKIIVWPEV